MPAVPAASAMVSSQVPDLALVPDDAAAIQSLGSVTVANTVPVRAAAQLAGGAPVRIFKIGAVPIVDSTASRRALRTATEYCSVISIYLICKGPPHASGTALIPATKWLLLG